jgi:hypothetical protein
VTHVVRRASCASSAKCGPVRRRCTICRYSRLAPPTKLLCGAERCLQIAWQMFHSKKRAAIMPDIVKQISATSDNAPCESKQIYPTAVLLDLCSTAFHCDHSLVDAHLRPVVAAFCARAKVRSPFFHDFTRSFARACFFIWRMLAIAPPHAPFWLRLQDFLTPPPGFQPVFGGSAASNLGIFHAGEFCLLRKPAHTLTRLYALYPALYHYSDFSDLLLLCTSSAACRIQPRPAAWSTRRNRCGNAESPHKPFMVRPFPRLFPSHRPPIISCRFLLAPHRIAPLVFLLFLPVMLRPGRHAGPEPCRKSVCSHVEGLLQVISI